MDGSDSIMINRIESTLILLSFTILPVTELLPET